MFDYGANVNTISSLSVMVKCKLYFQVLFSMECLNYYHTKSNQLLTFNYKQLNYEIYLKYYVTICSSEMCLTS
jgi:hypothetical protein